MKPEEAPEIDIGCLICDDKIEWDNVEPNMDVRGEYVGFNYDGDDWCRDESEDWWETYFARRNTQTN